MDRMLFLLYCPWLLTQVVGSTGIPTQEVDSLPADSTTLTSLSSLVSGANHSLLRTSDQEEEETTTFYAENVTSPTEEVMSSYPGADLLFRCHDETFVNKLYLCDGVWDCLDKSDERNCSSSGRILDHDRISCSSTQRNTSVWNACDGHQDCLNNEDEEHCNLVTKCPDANQILCQTLYDASNCVRKSRVKDQCLKYRYNNKEVPFPECDKHSFIDARKVENPPEKCFRPCPPQHYRCRFSTTCIHRAHICDGVVDCPRADDEKFCSVLLAPNCTFHHADPGAGTLKSTITCGDSLTNRTEIFRKVRHPRHPRTLSYNLRILYNRDLISSATREGSWKWYITAVKIHHSNLRLAQMNLPSFPNLRYLDVRHNKYLCLRTMLPQVFDASPLLDHVNAIGIEAEAECLPDFKGNEEEWAALKNRSVRVDAKLEFMNCCYLAAFVKASCSADHEGDRLTTCRNILGNSMRIFLWILVIGAIPPGLVYIVVEVKKRGRDRFRYHSSLSIYIGDMFMVISYIALLSQAEYVADRFYSMAPDWQTSIQCWLVNVLHKVSFTLRGLGTVNNILVTTIKFQISPSAYSLFEESKYGLIHKLFLVFIPLVNVVAFLPISEWRVLSHPLCNSFHLLIQNVARTKDYLSLAVYIGLPGVILTAGLIAMLICWLRPKKLESLAIQTPKRRYRVVRQVSWLEEGNWTLHFPTVSATFSVIFNAFILLLGGLGFMSPSMPELEGKTLDAIVVVIMALSPWLNPLAFIIARFIQCGNEKMTAKSPLRRSSGLGQEFSMQYETMQEHIKQNGMLTPREGVAVALCMAEALKYIHGEGMVCDVLSEELILVGKNSKGRLMNCDLAVKTEYPKFDVHEWRCQRDVADYGLILGKILRKIEPSESAKKRNVTFKIPNSDKETIVY